MLQFLFILPLASLFAIAILWGLVRAGKWFVEASSACSKTQWLDLFQWPWGWPGVCEAKSLLSWAGFNIEPFGIMAAVSSPFAATVAFMVNIAVAAIPFILLSFAWQASTLTRDVFSKHIKF